MCYSLIGRLQSTAPYDNIKTIDIAEYFDAENLEKAIVIARALLQSYKIKSDKGGNTINTLQAGLRDDIRQVVWISCLTPKKVRLREEVVTPEYFYEEVIHP